MKKTRLLTATLFLLCAMAGLAFSGEQSQGIVVWRLEAKTGVSESDIDSISGIVTAEVEKQSGLKVVSEADIRTILKGQEVKQACGADDSTCVAEIGSALGVPEAVSGDLGRLGNMWVLNLRRINVKKAEVIKRVTRQVDGPIEALIRAIPGAVAELFDKPIPAEEKPVAQATTAAPEKDKTFMIAGWALVGSGLGLVVFGGISHWQAKEANGEDKSKFDLWRAMTFTGYAVGGAAAAAGAALLIVDAFVPRSAVSYGITPAPNGFSAGLQIRF